MDTQEDAPLGGEAPESSSQSIEETPQNQGFESATDDSEGAGSVPDPEALLYFGALHLDTQELVRLLYTVFDIHAWRALGLVADPRTGAVRKDLPSAQLAIDVVHFLLGKLETALSDSERRDAQRRLNDLRVNYLAKAREEDASPSA